MLARVASDYRGLCRVCGTGVATIWLSQIAWHLRECMKSRSLTPADRAMGSGPFRARCHDGAQRRLTGSALLDGEVAISAIRELWVRDVYLGGEFIAIPDTGTVVDLGANRGVFTARALASGRNV